jgi:hypothetical protein
MHVTSFANPKPCGNGKRLKELVNGTLKRVAVMTGLSYMLE